MCRQRSWPNVFVAVPAEQPNESLLMLPSVAQPPVVDVGPAGGPVPPKRVVYLKAACLPALGAFPAKFGEELNADAGDEAGDGGAVSGHCFTG